MSGGVSNARALRSDAVFPSNDLLTPPDRLLLMAVSHHWRDWEAARAVENTSFPWAEVSKIAIANRVQSFVAGLVNEEPLASRVHASIRADWRAQRMLLVFRWEMVTQEVGEIVAALAADGVDMLLYKGLDFQTRYYTDACPRGFSDIDIVVRPHDVASAHAALVGDSYRPTSTLPLDYYRRFHLHAVYRHPARPRPVELHWALDSPFASTDGAVPLVFADAEASRVSDAHVLRPSQVDALALMAMHLDKHVGLAATLRSPETRMKALIDERGLVWVLDVVRWMRRAGGESDPQKLLDRIRALGGERALIVALRLAADLDPEALPTWARELAERLPRRTPLLARLVYPDLCAGNGITPRGRRTRAFLLSMRPVLGFRPVRVLEALLPRQRISGVTREGLAERVYRAGRRAALITTNLAALASIRLRTIRHRARDG